MNSESVDLDCQCGLTLCVPIVMVDTDNIIHLDHDFIAEHIATHDERQPCATKT